MQSSDCCLDGCVDNCSDTRANNAPKRHFNRPQLFNWITVSLLVGWVGIVTVIAESTTVVQTDIDTGSMDAQGFIQATLMKSRR